jgi:hypothetical protein
MTNNDLKIYENYWIQRDKYCLGPVEDFIKILFNWENENGIYLCTVFQYIPYTISDVKIRDEVIKRMKESGCNIITHVELTTRGDLTRMWGDRKKEFALKRRPDFKHKYDYTVVHQPSKKVVRTGHSGNARDEIIKKMIEAGIEIIEEDEL